MYTIVVLPRDDIRPDKGQARPTGINLQQWNRGEPTTMMTISIYAPLNKIIFNCRYRKHTKALLLSTAGRKSEHAFNTKLWKYLVHVHDFIHVCIPETENCRVARCNTEVHLEDNQPQHKTRHKKCKYVCAI